MNLEKIVEIGATEEVFGNFEHPYTEALLSAIPTPDPRRSKEDIESKGTVPSPISPPSGCRYHTHCLRVVQSDEYDLEQSARRTLLTFQHRISNGEIDAESTREFVATERETDPEMVPDDALACEIRTQFELPDQLSDRDAECELADAIDHFFDGDVEGAAEILSSAFRTPCEEYVPTLQPTEAGHEVSCHLRHPPDGFEIDGAGMVSVEDAAPSDD